MAAGEHDVALVSAGVAEGLAAPKIRALRRHLSAGTYYAPGRLLVLLRADSVERGQAVQRVAIDHQPPDHVSLTVSELPEAGARELVETPFPAVPTAVLRGEVAAGVWHITSSVIPLELAGLATGPLTRPAALEVSERSSGAVLVGWKGRPELASMLPARQARALLDEDQVHGQHP